MTEFTNADNTGGYIIPDDVVPFFAPIFAAEGCFPVESPRTELDAWERIASRMAQEQERLFFAGPQCEPLGIFNTPNQIRLTNCRVSVTTDHGNPTVTGLIEPGDDEPQPIIVEAK